METKAGVWTFKKIKETMISMKWIIRVKKEDIKSLKGTSKLNKTFE